MRRLRWSRFCRKHVRVLLLNHNVAWSGGTFFRAWHIGRHLAASGHTVTLMSIAARARLRFHSTGADGITHVESPDLLWGPGRTGWDPWDTTARCAWVARGTWDVVHAFDSRPAVIAPALVARRRGAALVMDWADWWGRGGTIEERPAGARLRWLIRPLETFFEEAFRTRADATTVISTALERRAVTLGVPPETILRLPQGSDVNSIEPRAREACRAELGLDACVPLLGYVGALALSDARLLWDTVRAIRAKLPAARLVLVGNPRVRVPADVGAVQIGVVPRARLLAWLGACDVLLLPLQDTIASRARWPSKANDYLAAGRPIAATRVGDLAPLIDAAGAGRVTNPDPDELAQAAIEIATDRDGWGTRCAAARDLAERVLAWPRLVALLEARYAAALRVRHSIP